MNVGAGITIKFRGVRGSFPVPGPTTAKTGGNSSCVEVRAGGKVILFDAGTGIIPVGHELVRSAGPREVHIFLSHLHHDHIEGLRFFKPFYKPDWTCHLYGPDTASPGLDDHLAQMMRGRFFPLEMSDLLAKIEIHALTPGGKIDLGGRPRVRIAIDHTTAHPRFGVHLFRLECAGKSVVYATDVEAPLGGLEKVVSFAKGADVLIHDAQYTEHEYFRREDNRQGWGHSTVRMAAEAARAAEVGRLVLYHHDPCRKDSQIAPLEKLARKIFPRVTAAREGKSLRIAD